MRDARDELQHANELAQLPGRTSVRISFPKPAIVFAACVGGPCDQGRKPCPSPQACAKAEEPDPGYFKRLAWRVAVLASILFLASCIAGLYWGVTR